MLPARDTVVGLGCPPTDHPLHREGDGRSVDVEVGEGGDERAAGRGQERIGVLWWPLPVA